MFDPFGDFESRGYLRNIRAEKDLAKVRVLEHFAFLDRLSEALQYLQTQEYLTYADVLAAHRILFGTLYPWAGQDRSQTSPDLAIRKGSVLFAHPAHARRAVEYGLQRGQDPSFMATKPGEVLGYLAYGHPFLDGNGRTLMSLHVELAQRAGISIDWPHTAQLDYLKALTQEIDQPGQGHLD